MDSLLSFLHLLLLLQKAAMHSLRYQYNLSRDEWSHLCHCCQWGELVMLAMASLCFVPRWKCTAVKPLSGRKTLPDTPLKVSAAASLSGNLLTVGGYNVSTPSSSAVYIFLSLTNSWVRVTTGDHLPKPRYNCTAVQLSSNQLLVVGGRNCKKLPRLYTWGLSQSRTVLLHLCLVSFSSNMRTKTAVECTT